MDYYDIAVRNSELKEQMQSLGWSTEVFDVERNFITNDDWGEVKKEIHSTDAVNILVNPDPELTAKAVELEDLDAVMSPEKGRKDAGINHVIAKAASENDTTVVLSFQNLLTSRKQRMNTLSSWRTAIKLAEKYDFKLILSTEATDSFQLRNPKDIEALLRTLDVEDAGKLLKHNPYQILEERL